MTDSVGPPCGVLHLSPDTESFLRSHSDESDAAHIV